MRILVEASIETVQRDYIIYITHGVEPVHPPIYFLELSPEGCSVFELTQICEKKKEKLTFEKYFPIPSTIFWDWAKSLN